MELRPKKFMTVTLDIVPEGMNVSCWISTESSWLLEIIKFPFHYNRPSETCIWMIHCNTDMTVKMVNMVTEYADKICAEGVFANKNRKVANR